MNALMFNGKSFYFGLNACNDERKVKTIPNRLDKQKFFLCLQLFAAINKASTDFPPFSVYNTVILSN